MEYEQKPKTVAGDKLKSFCCRCLYAIGISEEDARIISEVMIESNLRGIDSQGIIRLLTYVKRTKAGAMNPRPNLKIIRESPTIAVLDGDGGFGQLVSTKAMRIAMDKAKVMDVGIVGVLHSSHFGAASSYSTLCLPHDMIGFATTNASPTMAAWGGASHAVGNNPISYAIPTGTEIPIVLDMAQSVVGLGKLRVVAKKGEKIPLGWAINSRGEPTNDPNEGLHGGFLLPIGGYKGYGLAVVMDILSGVLTGSPFGKDLPKKEIMIQENCGHFFQAIKIEAFMPIREFKKRIDSLIRQIKASEKSIGTKEIVLPGEIEYRTKKEREKKGVPIFPQLYVDLVKAGEELEVKLDF